MRQTRCWPSGLKEPQPARLQSARTRCGGRRASPMGTACSDSGGRPSRSPLQASLSHPPPPLRHHPHPLALPRFLSTDEAMRALGPPVLSELTVKTHQ